MVEESGISLGPNESKEITLKVNGDIPGNGTGTLEITWTCGGCGKDNLKRKRVKVREGVGEGGEISIWCQFCTPVWMKARNFLRSLWG